MSNCFGRIFAFDLAPVRELELGTRLLGAKRVRDPLADDAVVGPRMTRMKN